jgi:hypothetical protein
MPLEILFACSACRGSGQYVGFTEVDDCKVCVGRKFVPPADEDRARL